jgi:hypothetical protein
MTRKLGWTLLLILALAACSPAGHVQPTAKSSPPPGVVASSWWRPGQGSSLQLDLSSPTVDTSVKADIYIIDLNAPQATIDSLHAAGRKVLCYFSIGTWESTRPDASQFPSAVIGNPVEDSPGEKWLDIRQLTQLAPIMLDRMSLCKSKGFDGVDPGNAEVAGSDSGFPVSDQDQLTYSLWLAGEAHARGLAIALQNAPVMVKDSVQTFDFAIAMDCFHDGTCASMQPFIAQGKAVFAVEHSDTGVDFQAACQYGSQNKMTFLLKKRAMDSWVQYCP